MKKKHAKVIYDSSEQSSDMLYASGFRAPDPFLYFDCSGGRFLAVPPLEFDRALRTCSERMKVIEISKDPEDIIFELAGGFKISSIHAPYFFPSGLALSLMKKGISVEPLAPPFFPKRQIKSRQELAKIAEALKIAECAMRKAEKVLRESSVGPSGVLLWCGEELLSETLRRIIDMEICSNGASSSATIVSCGRDSAEPHNQGAGPIMAGRPIVIDIFPRVASGYWGDITRTFVKWKASKEFLSIYDAVKTAGEKAAAKAREGVCASKLHELAFDILKSRGFKTARMKGARCGFFHGLGHGVGLDVHEAPAVSPRNDKPLRRGNVVTIEPGLYYPDFGGVRIEDMVFIGKSGAELLTDYHKNPVLD